MKCLAPKDRIPGLMESSTVPRLDSHLLPLDVTTGTLSQCVSSGWPLGQTHAEASTPWSSDISLWGSDRMTRASVTDAHPRLLLTLVPRFSLWLRAPQEQVVLGSVHTVCTRR